MPPIDPRWTKAKRFPVHAAVDRCNADELIKLLEEDASFHVGRKLPDTDISVLHTACTARHGPSADDGQHQQLFAEIAKFLLMMGAEINELDSIGQTPLHYAVCHTYALPIVRVLVDKRADLNIQRNADGWTALHLSAMFGKSDVAHCLLEAGADPEIRDTSNKTAEDTAKHYRHHQLADLLSSPRELYKPKQTFPKQYQELFGGITDQKSELPVIKFKDEHVAWRDACREGNTLLHIAAWKGDIVAAKCIFNSIKARKLTSVQNKKGASPLAMAIISGQTPMIEEFFMNKHAKKLVELDVKLLDTQQTIVHLLLQYAPYVHPKFILKRKDFTEQMLNAKDKQGYHPLLYLSSRNSSSTIKKILASKNVKEGNFKLDLSTKDPKNGKTILHYLVKNRDDDAFRILLDKEELTPEIANMPDSEGNTPLITCLSEGSPYMAMDILQHPTAQEKFRLDSCHTKDGRSPLHLVAEQGVGSLWHIAVARPDCDMNARDCNGNTPLMKAVICHRAQMLEAWLADVEGAQIVDQSVKNNEGKTLLMLFIEHLDSSLTSKMTNLLCKTVNIRDCVNDVNKEGSTAVMMAASQTKWGLIKELLTNPGLKIIPEEGEGVETDEDGFQGCVDLHKANSSGQTALVVILLARVKLARQEQTYLMKKQRVLAAEARSEIDLLWDLVTMILAREKEQHGSTVVQGKDGGSNCLKKQMGPFKLIRMQNVDEIVNEYTKQYQFIKKKRPSVALQKSLETSEFNLAFKIQPSLTTLDVRNNNANLTKANNAVKKPVNNNNKNISSNTKNNQVKTTMNGKLPQIKKVLPESDSESSESEGEEPEETESPEPEKEVELSEKEIAEICSNTSKILEEAKLRRQKKAEERRKTLEEGSKLEKELEYKARRLKEAFIIADEEEDDGTMDVDDNDPIAPHSKITSSILLGTNAKQPSNSVSDTKNEDKSDSSYKTQRSYTRTDPTADIQRRIMESIMENELAMAQNETNVVDSKPSYVADDINKPKDSVSNNDKISLDSRNDIVSKPTVECPETMIEPSVENQPQIPNKKDEESSKNILDFIQMVDNKIGKLKETPVKEDDTFSSKVLDTTNDCKLDNTNDNKTSLGIQRNKVNDDATTEYNRRITEEIMENELAMEQNEVTYQVDPKPLVVNDELVDLRTRKENLDESNKPVNSSISYTSSKLSDNKLSKNDTEKHDKLTKPSKGGSYEKIMKYLKTQEDTEKKRNDEHSDDIPRAERSFDLATRGKIDQPSGKGVATTDSSNKNLESGIEEKVEKIDEDKNKDKASSNDFMVENEGVPDKMGYKSIATQTIEINTCRCCCTCKNSSFQ